MTLASPSGAPAAPASGTPPAAAGDSPAAPGERPSRRLRRSILVYSVLTLLVACSLVAVAAVVPLTLRLRAQGEVRVRAVALARAADVERAFTETLWVARRMAGRTGLRQAVERLALGRADEAEVRAFVQTSLSDAIAAEPSVAGVAVLGLGGAMLGHAGVSLPVAALHPGGGRKKDVRLAAWPTELDGEPHLILDAEVLGSQETAVGRIVAAFRFEQMRQVIREGVVLGPGDQTYLGWFPDRAEPVLVALDETEVLPVGQAPDVLAALRRAEEGGAGVIRLSRPGSSAVLLAHAPVMGTDWSLCARHAEADLLRGFDRLLERLAALIVVLMAGSVLGLLLLLRPLAGRLLLHTEDLERQIEQHTQTLRGERAALQEMTDTLAAQGKELQVANQDLDAFARTAAHDLRNPLGNIRGAAEVLRRQTDQGRTDSYGRGLDIIERSAARAEELIAALLDFARAGRAPLRRAAVDLSALASRIGEELLGREPGRPVELTVAPGLVVEADPALLAVALTNLLGNALKYSAKAESPRVELGTLSPTEPSGPRVFFVRDNGAGFDMLFADRLFTPFARLHSARDFPGTGVGLSTVARIVERHGGRIWAEAAVGHGATFFFTLG